jgi:hypothetical protein
MNKQNHVISIHEARTILGADAKDMTDAEIEYVIETLDIMAKDALKLGKEELHRKRDAKRMAELIYDIYQDKKSKGI